MQLGNLHFLSQMCHIKVKRSSEVKFWDRVKMWNLASFKKLKSELWGEHWNMKVTWERKQGEFSVGFHRKKVGHWMWDPKKWAFFWCELPKIPVGGHSVYIWSKLNEKLPFLAEYWQNFKNAHEACKKFMLTFLKKGHCMWTVVKNGSLGVRFV